MKRLIVAVLSLAAAPALAAAQHAPDPAPAVPLSASADTLPRLPVPDLVPAAPRDVVGGAAEGALAGAVQGAVLTRLAPSCAPFASAGKSAVAGAAFGAVWGGVRGLLGKRRPAAMPNGPSASRDPGRAAIPNVPPIADEECLRYAPFPPTESR